MSSNRTATRSVTLRVENLLKYFKANLYSTTEQPDYESLRKELYNSEISYFNRVKPTYVSSNYKVAHELLSTLAQLHEHTKSKSLFPLRPSLRSNLEVLYEVNKYLLPTVKELGVQVSDSTVSQYLLAQNRPGLKNWDSTASNVVRQLDHALLDSPVPPEVLQLLNLEQLKKSSDKLTNEKFAKSFYKELLKYKLFSTVRKEVDKELQKPEVDRSSKTKLYKKLTSLRTEWYTKYSVALDNSGSEAEEYLNRLVNEYCLSDYEKPTSRKTLTELIDSTLREVTSKYSKYLALLPPERYNKQLSYVVRSVPKSALSSKSKLLTYFYPLFSLAGSASRKGFAEYKKSPRSLYTLTKQAKQALFNKREKLYYRALLSFGVPDEDINPVTAGVLFKVRK